MSRSAASQKHNITIDNSFGTPQTLTGPTYGITANLGKQVGGNLFHSFGKFGLDTGESAAFSGPASVSNVIGRVTGGNLSPIDGHIQSNIAGASLYLINPSGVVFGPHATVNVSGGFHASTANYIKMSDGAKFQATNPSGSTLSAAPPAAFGFLTAKPAAISVNGSSLGPVPGTFGLVAGPISVTGQPGANPPPALSAPGGTIHVTSVAGTGEVPVDPRNTSALTVTSFGPVDLKGGKTLDVGSQGGVGGSVFVHAGALTISSTEISADNYGSGRGGVIALRGESKVVLTDGSYVHALTGDGSGADIFISTAPSGFVTADDSTVLTGSGGSGSAGPIAVSTGQLTVKNGAELASVVLGTGTAAPITVGADTVVVDGTAGPAAIISITSGADARAAAAGDIAIVAGEVKLMTHGAILSATTGSGNAGNISLQIAGNLAIDGTSATKSTELTGIVSTTKGMGTAGNVAVTAGNLKIVNNGQIGSSTSGPGNAGSVSVVVGGALSIDAAGADPSGLTGIAANAEDSSTGKGGQVSVAAGDLSIVNRGTISSDALGAGSGGSVSVTAGTLRLANFGAITGDTAEAGSGGNVAVNAGNVLIGPDGQITTDTLGAGTGGNTVVNVSGALRIDGASQVGSITGITALVFPDSTGQGGNITVTAGSLSIGPKGQITTDTFGTGKGGNIAVTVAGALSIEGTPSGNLTGISSFALTNGAVDAGNITVNAGSLQIANNGFIAADTLDGSGRAGSITVNVAGPLVINGAGPDDILTGISSRTGFSLGNSGQVQVAADSVTIANGGEISVATFGVGAGGDLRVNANALSLVTNGMISASTFGVGAGGSVSVNVAGDLAINGIGSLADSTPTGIIARTRAGNGGNAGRITVSAGNISILDSGIVSTSTFGAGAAGEILVNAFDRLVIAGANTPGSVTGIASSANFGMGNAGRVTVNTGELSIAHGGEIQSLTFDFGNGGDVTVSAEGKVGIDGSGGGQLPTGLLTNAESGSAGRAGAVTLIGRDISITGGGLVTSGTAGQGSGGTVQVSARGSLDLTGAGSGIIASAGSTASGDAGSVTVGASRISVSGGAEISSTTAGFGVGGSVAVTTPGALMLDGAGVSGTQIAASATGPRSGHGGSVNVAADTLTIRGGARIAATTAGPGKGGDVAVVVANGVNLSGTGPDGASGISASAEPGSTGPAGQIVLMAGGAVALTNGAKVTSSTAGKGDAGTVRVSSQGPLSLTGPGSGILVSATSTASGNAGSVMVTAPQIALVAGAEISSTTAGTGAGGSVNVMTPGRLVLDGAGIADTQIAASAIGRQSGPGGSITVAADALTIEGGARIASTTFGPGKAGDIGVIVAHDVTMSGSGPNGASGVTASAEEGSSGRAGEVVLVAGGAVALAEGARVTSSTAGAGGGGTVQVTAGEPLTLTDPGTGIIASATATASGDAGSVVVAAPQITITTGAEISSTTAGTGAGGSVVVSTSGALALNGGGNRGTQIAASAIGPQSGPGGSVTVNADSLVVQGGAQIASSTAGPGKGGDVNVSVASDIVLPDRGPQITARSTGSGDAGSITVSAVRLLMSNGAAISTEAETSTASGGNITLHVDDFLYLVSSSVTTSVKGETGNGGNIAIDPQLAILNHSSLVAEAIEGHGGNITITAGQFTPSSDSIISATSQLGISGIIEINGPRVDVNGALVVLSSELRGRAAVLREACAARSDRPISSLVDAGRGGLPQDPEASLPALYIAGRDLSTNPSPGGGPIEADGSAVQTTVHLMMRCSG